MFKFSEGEELDMASADRSTLFINATVLDGSEDMEPQPDMAVTVERGVITWMGPSAVAQAPAGAEVIDLAGAYLMPGLINMHVHLCGSGKPVSAGDAGALMKKLDNPVGRAIVRHILKGSAQQQLASGVTTVRGAGDPNEPDGAYQQAIGVLYAVAYTLKMSYKTDHRIDGFFEYVVPPLEGFWWQENSDGVDYTDKSAFNWISVIRLPDFITKADFDWAVETATKKKKLDCSSAEFMTIEEGLCVQIMHLGAFDDEPTTVALMDAYLEQNGYVNDMSKDRLHHEIYLSDARKVAPEKWKTVIRHPVKKV